MSADTDLKGRGRRDRYAQHYGSAMPYVGQWTMWFIAMPALGTLGWWLGWDAPTWVVWPGHIEIPLGPRSESSARLLAALIPVTALALAALSVLIGLGHTRRRATGPTENLAALVVIHVAASWVLGATLVDLIIIFGWSLPLAVLIACGAAFGAFGWNMYRTDPFRADPREKEEGEESELGKAIGIVTSRPKLKEIERGEFTTKIPFEHGIGETQETIAKALPKMESATGSMASSGRIESGKHAGQSVMVLTHSDPFQRWLEIPGLTSPGGTLADGIGTAYYTDSMPQRYYLAGTGDGRRPRSAILRQGTTGAGKSGDFDIELAECMTRRDTLTARIDTVKFMQNTGWALDGLTLGADTNARSTALQAAFKAILDWRSSVLGDMREWTTAAFDELGLAAWVLQIDEADADVLEDLAEYFATKALSLGGFMSVTIPSADHKSMPTVIRKSLGNRKCFGTGDDISASMVLTDSTLKNGPDPFEWGAQFAGAHLLDRAPGVDPKRFVVPCRTWRASHGTLHQLYTEARETFDPAKVHPREREILEEFGAWEDLQPAALRARAERAQAEARDQAPAGAEREQIIITPRERPRGEKVQVTEAFKTPEYEPNDIDQADREEYEQINPRKPLVEDPDAPKVGKLAGAKPRPADESEAIQEFNRVALAMYAEGVRVFTNGQLIDRCELWDSVTMTRYLRELNEGKAINPPGLTITRIKRGHHRMSKGE